MDDSISRRSMLLRVICFLAIFGILLSAASYLLTPRTIVRDNFWSEKNARGFLAEPDNTLDILAFGHSSLYAGFAPPELWNAYGFTSYAASQPYQSLQQTYDLLKEALEYQKPRLVILETDAFIDSVWDIKEVDNMVHGSVEKLFPAVKYHNRWKRLNWGRLTQSPDFDRFSAAKGYRPSSHVGKVSKKAPPKSEAVGIPLTTTFYLNKILSLCKENRIQVLLVQMPITSWTDAYHDAVADLADKHGIGFIDFKTDSSLIQLDWGQDFRDSGRHMNDRGSKKATLYLGQYIKEHYALADHRGDKRFAHWDQDYKTYLTEKKSGKSKYS